VSDLAFLWIVTVLRARSHPKAPYSTLLQKRKYPTHMAPFNVKWDAEGF